jgi:hypothetical protein
MPLGILGVFSFDNTSCNTISLDNVLGGHLISMNIPPRIHEEFYTYIIRVGLGFRLGADEVTPVRS